jgi:hypothetical protein
MPRGGYIAKTQERWVFEEPGCRGFPTAMTEKKWRGAVGKGYPERAGSCDMDPDEEGSEGCEAKGRELNTKRYQARGNPNPKPVLAFLTTSHLSSTPSATRKPLGIEPKASTKADK